MKKIITITGMFLLASLGNTYAQDHSVSGDWEINVDNNNNDIKIDQFWVSYGKERKKLFEVNPEEIKANSKRFDFSAKVIDRFGIHHNSSISSGAYGIQLHQGEGGSLSITQSGISGQSHDSFAFSLPHHNSNGDLFENNFRVTKRSLDGRINRKLIIDEKNTRVFNSLVVLTDVGVNRDKVILKADENLVDVQAALLKGKKAVIESSISANELIASDKVSAKDINVTNQVTSKTIIADKVTLRVGSFPDYVFANDYKLMPLEEVASFIKKHQHLPNMKSEREVVKEGMDLKELTLKLVEKVEELTLYTIQQQQLINKLQAKPAANKK
ncbi:hypothetical protein [uncultured Tenacibaculum sp.]|uniref:hypothetical protein n=1 Tax=uncultured Tenacibaculum sp. TaxID=174713 RepID=UPI00262F6BF1|nr:hypothetical protein [uncultured Tenacibaculum sp.]